MKALAICLMVLAGVAHAEGKDEFLQSKIDSWFAEARPIGKGLFVTDANGCLYSVFANDKGSPQLIAMLTNDKKPLCRKPASK